MYLKSDAHWMWIVSNSLWEVDMKKIQNELFKIHTMLSLPWNLRLPCWLGLWHVVVSLFSVLLLQRCWGRKRLVFWWVVQHSSNPNSSVVLLCLTHIAAHSGTWAGQASKQPSSIILVNWYRFFQHFVAFFCYLHLPLFALYLLLCHVNTIDACTSNAHSIRFTSDAHQKCITISFI